MGKSGSGTTGYSTAAVLKVCPEDRPADFFWLPADGQTGCHMTERPSAGHPDMMPG